MSSEQERHVPESLIAGHVSHASQGRLAQMMDALYESGSIQKNLFYYIFDSNATNVVLENHMRLLSMCDVTDDAKIVV